MTYQTTVHGEDLFVDDRGNGQAVETVGKSLPQFDVISSFAWKTSVRHPAPPRPARGRSRTFVVKSVNPVDTRALVVSTEDEKVLGVLDLVREQETDRLEGLLSSVDIITQEEVICLGGEPAVLEQSQQVVVLPVDVTADLDRRLELEQDGLADEDFAGFGAEVLDLVLEQLHGLARSVSSD